MDQAEEPLSECGIYPDEDTGNQDTQNQYNMIDKGLYWYALWKIYEKSRQP